jgi:hypothetical protein
VIGEGEHGGAVVGSSSSSDDPTTVLIRELSNGCSIQLRADEEQLGAGTFVLPFDAIPVKVRSNADIWDFEDAEIHG